MIPGMAIIRRHITALFLLGAVAIAAAVEIPVQSAGELRVVSYNTKHGRGNDNIVDLDPAHA